MDPVEADNPLRLKMQKLLDELLADFPEVESYHDLRVAPGKNHTRIIFDVVVPPGVSYSREQIIEAATRAVKEVDETFEVRIYFDQAYI